MSERVKLTRIAALLLLVLVGGMLAIDAIHESRKLVHDWSAAWVEDVPKESPRFAVEDARDGAAWQQGHDDYMSRNPDWYLQQHPSDSLSPDDGIP
jgi:hypothetical protein